MASASASNILIVGATGVIGRFITDAIVAAKPPFHRVTIFTSTTTVETKGELLDSWKKAGNVSVVTGNVDSESDVKAAYKKQSIDTVVSAVGRGAIEKQINLIKWADETDNVTWFFPSEYGTDIEYGPKSKGEKPHQKKLAVRRFVHDVVKRLQVTYVVTGPYFDMWVRQSPEFEYAGGFNIKKREATVVDEGEGKVGFTTMPDVGKLVVAAMRHPDASVGKALKVQSFVVTPNQALAEYEKQTGHKWKVSHTTLNKLIQLEAATWEKGDPRATLLTLRRIWAEGGTLYDKTDNESIGLKHQDMDSLELAVKRDLENQH